MSTLRLINSTRPLVISLSYLNEVSCLSDMYGVKLRRQTGKIDIDVFHGDKTRFWHR